MIININNKIKKILDCDNVVLQGCGSYIVNHTLKQIAGPYMNIENTVIKAFYPCRTLRQHTNMTKLLVHPDTILEDKEYDYTKIAVSGKIASTPYYTEDDIKQVKKCCGIYSISSKNLNTIYIGETITSFHKRWLSHCSSPMNKVKKLLQQDDVIFRILEICKPDKVTTLAKEYSTITKLKESSDKIVLGGCYSICKNNIK